MQYATATRISRMSGDDHRYEVARSDEVCASMCAV